MEVLIIEMVERFGYIGIILLIALENIFPPIPSEVILTFGGFLTTYTKLNVWGVILSATIGSVAGAIVLYIVGRCLTGERLMQLVDGKLGKRLHFNRDDVECFFLPLYSHSQKSDFHSGRHGQNGHGQFYANDGDGHSDMERGPCSSRRLCRCFLGDYYRIYGDI